MKRQLCWLCIGLLAVFCFRAYSQEASKPDQEPFELPEFIITGKAEIGIPTYQKPLPHPPALLSAQALQRQFYSLEKIPPPPLPMPKFPSLRPLPAPARGFLKAAIGLFPTVSLRGTYRGYPALRRFVSMANPIPPAGEYPIFPGSLPFICP